MARRWKTQFNENAKNWAFYEEFSELNHNAIVGYEYPGAFKEMARVVVLDGAEVHPRLRTRMDVTDRLMDEYGISYRRVRGGRVWDAWQRLCG